MAATDSNRPPAKVPAAPAIDPRSDALLLAYRDGPAGYGVPARDLHGNDLLRIARVRALSESGGEPVDHASPVQLAALYDELVGSGAFKPYVAPPAEPAPAPEVAPPTPISVPDLTPVVPAPEA